MPHQRNPISPAAVLLSSGLGWALIIQLKEMTSLIWFCLLHC